MLYKKGIPNRPCVFCQGLPAFLTYAFIQFDTLPKRILCQIPQSYRINHIVIFSLIAYDFGQIRHFGPNLIPKIHKTQPSINSFRHGLWRPLP